MSESLLSGHVTRMKALELSVAPKTGNIWALYSEMSSGKKHCYLAERFLGHISLMLPMQEKVPSGRESVSICFFLGTLLKMSEILLLPEAYF
jgi:hypothetical protein